jgi:hypothetical protein
MANGQAANFITPKEITSELGVNYQAFMRKLRRGEGPKFKRYGARYLIRKDWYEKWIDKDGDQHHR